MSHLLQAIAQRGLQQVVRLRLANTVDLPTTAELASIQVANTIFHLRTGGSSAWQTGFDHRPKDQQAHFRRLQRSRADFIHRFSLGLYRICYRSFQTSDFVHRLDVCLIRVQLPIAELRRRSADMAHSDASGPHIYKMGSLYLRIAHPSDHPPYHSPRQARSPSSPWQYGTSVDLTWRLRNNNDTVQYIYSGGGIGGVTLACALSNDPNVQIDLYEAANKFGEIGAGLGVWWRGRRVLQMLGLDEEMTAIGGPVTDTRQPTFRLRKADQPEGHSFITITSRGGVSMMHRADFHSILLSHLSSRCKTYNSKRLVKYVNPETSEEPIQLFFEDGSTATCDVLVGADGLKSSVRQAMMQRKADITERGGNADEAAEHRDASRARYSGLMAYRTVISSEKLASIAPEHRALTTHNMFVGKNCHIVAYPISEGRLVNVAIFCAGFNLEGSNFPDPWISQDDPQHVLGLFDDWELEVRQLVGCLEGTTVNKWAVNVVKPMSSYTSGRVALLGDAAHAMTPLRGAGAGQAIEDAQILAAVLSHNLITKENVAQALEVYSKIRQPIASGVAEASRQNGMLLSLHVEGEVDAVRLEEIGKTIQTNFDWYTEVDPADDVKTALELLESMLSPKS